jgi:hypothetical protein
MCLPKSPPTISLPLTPEEAQSLLTILLCAPESAQVSSAQIESLLHRILDALSSH